MNARQAKKQDNKLTTNTTVDTKDIKAEAAKVEAPEAVKAEPAKEEAAIKKANVKKTADKKTVAKKAVEKKNEAVAEIKKAVEKTATKKAAKKEAVTPQIAVQYNGNESTVASIVEKITAEYVSEGHRASSIKDLKVYLKPEDGLAYYVINEKVAGSVSLF